MWDGTRVVISAYIVLQEEEGIQKVIASLGTSVNDVTLGRVGWAITYIGQEHDSTNES